MDKAGREKRNQEILESYNLGNSYFKMSETFGLSKGGVHKIIQAIKNEKPIIPQPKQETIEEVAQKYAKEQPLNKTSHMKGFLAGAKHQSEKMFSEGEVLLLLKQSNIMAPDFGWGEEDLEEWFTQHKKH